jgi:hypothetical protein
MTDSALDSALAARFRAVNGDHPMTDADDAYATRWFVPLDQLAGREGLAGDELRRLMLSNRLPLPGYLRSDGTPMVAPDLLALARRAGGFDALPEWFAAQFDDPVVAVREWDAYLSGQYVCLRAVTPETMRRKSELVDAIEAHLAAPRPDRPEWRAGLHGCVDELDALEPPFAPYDRLRFGGPVSRDRLIDAVRTRYPDPPR